MNPYWNSTFVGFFQTFITRFFTGFPGGIAPDELQLFTLMAVCLSAALVGSFLVLRKMTMVANALTHTILPGLVVTYLILGGGLLSLSTLLVASLVTSLVTLAITEFCRRTLNLQEDASIGLVFTLLFAIGILGVTLYARSAHLGVELIMGNVDGLRPQDLKLAVGAALFNLGMTLFFYLPYKLSTFDPDYASSLGVHTGWYSYLLMLQTTLTIVAGFRAVGVILILSLLTGPVLIARLMTHRLSTLLGLAAAIGSLVSLIAIALARHLLSVYDLALSTGALVVSLLALIYPLCAYAKKAHCYFRKYRIHRAANARSGAAPEGSR
ncbi:MAG: metal ABC transporter permease [Simkaniaceae bacterium]|nr:metal ABC transporter permease [Simkaniaceae bacterium]